MKVEVFQNKLHATSENELCIYCAGWGASTTVRVNEMVMRKVAGLQSAQGQIHSTLYITCSSLLLL